VDWAQIDAPRHFYLHTLKSIEILCRQAQLGINRVVFDSSEFQFWASEQYKMDIPLRSEKSYVNNPTSSMFTGDQISQYKALAAKLNGQQQGDQAAFYLTK
jgi:hypothetical protein